MADELTEKIRQAAEGPAKISGDAGSVEQHSLRDLIEADRYLASRESVQKSKRGLRFSKLIPPGTS